MRDIVEIGMGKTARRGYHLDEVALVPTRRTRASKDVSISWQLDAHEFALPLVAAPSDAIVSPSSAALIDSLGGLAVLNGEGRNRSGMSPERRRVLHHDRVRTMLGHVQERVGGILRLHHEFLEFEPERARGGVLFLL